MTPQNYYACRSQRRRREIEVELVLELVKAQREQQPRLGVRKLYYLIAPELKAAGVKLGRDRLFVELGKVGLLVEKKPSEWPKTTNFDPSLPVFVEVGTPVARRPPHRSRRAICPHRAPQANTRCIARRKVCQC